MQSNQLKKKSESYLPALCLLSHGKNVVPKVKNLHFGKSFKYKEYDMLLITCVF